MARALSREIHLTKVRASSGRAGARLPTGYGLMIGVGISIALWIGAARLVVGLLS